MNTASPLPRLLAQLRADRSALIAAVQGVPLALRRKRPSPDSWSVAEVLEHLSLIEPRVLGLMKTLIASAPPLSSDAQPTGPHDFDRSALSDRSRKIVAPPPVHPKGTLDIDELLAILTTVRDELDGILQQAHDRDLGAVSHPHPVFGPLNGFQWLAAHGGHESRHTMQIIEGGNALLKEDAHVNGRSLPERKGEAFEGDILLTVVGSKLAVGDRAPEFALDALAPGEALPREVTLASGAGRVRLLHVVNSLDTPVCNIGTHQFETRRAQELPGDVDVYTISMDLPFAQARWREAEHVGHEALSGHRSEAFGESYGVLLREWRLLQRAVFVIDGAGIVTHAEYVADQMMEPDYDAAVAAARAASRAH